MAYIPYIADSEIPERDRVPDTDNIIQIHGVHPRVMRHHYDLYLEIMRRMDLSPETTAVVEDSAFGIQAGKAAGAKVIAVPGGFTSPDNAAVSQADVRLESLHDLPSVLEGL